MRTRDIPATTAWSRCAVAPPRSAAGSRSRVRPGSAPWCESGRLLWATLPEVAPGPRESIAVVVVDDHELVRRGLLAFLDGEPDIEVIGNASGGAEALELLTEMESEGRRPDVVL